MRGARIRRTVTVPVFALPKPWTNTFFAEGSRGVSLLPSLRLYNDFQMTDEQRWYLLTRKKVEGSIVEAFRGLRRHGIEPILIKGWAAARNYPPDIPRFFGDIDLAVSAADFEKASELMITPESGVKGVDLHRELRHLDTVDWQTLLSNSELVEIDDEKIRILSDEDHLRVMCVHWLTDGAESKDRLWDVVYAVENRSADFDWSKCLDVVAPNRRGWTIATIGLAHRYLGLKIEDLPFAEDARRLPSWLTQCVERAWSDEAPMRPLHTAMTDARTFLYQIKKRIPPNPIQATIDCDAAFDERSRVGYQFRDVFIRLKPSLPRVIPALFRRQR